MKRFARDLLILVLFCSAFYLLTLFVGSKTAEYEGQSNFSKERRQADVSYRQRDWNAAEKLYKALIEEDPYNERAYLRYAEANHRLAVGQYDRYEKTLSSDDSKSTENEKRRKEIHQQIKESIAIQHHALQFPRGPRTSLKNLVVLHCLNGNKESAMETFRVFQRVQDSYAGGALSTDPHVKLLWDEREFFNFARRELMDRLPFLQ